MDIELMAAGAALVGLIVAFVLYKKNDSIEIEDKKVAEITQEIQDGAMAFLWAEYKILSIFVVIVAGLLYGRYRRHLHSSRILGWCCSKRI